MKKKILALCLVVVLAVTAVTGATLAYFTDTTEVVNNTFTMGKVKIDLDEAKVDDDGKAIKPEERVKKNDYTPTNMVPGHIFEKDPTIHVEAGSEESYIFLDMTINKYSSLFWVMAADASEDENIQFTIFNDEGALKSEFKNDNGVFSTTKFIKAMLANKAIFQSIINKWFTGIEHTDWEVCDIFVGKAEDDVTVDGKYLTIRFAYNTTVNAKKSDTNIDIKFMDSFQMPTSVTQEMIENGTTVGGMQNNFNTGEAKFKMNFKAYAIQADEIADLAAAYKAMFDLTKGDTLTA